MKNKGNEEKAISVAAATGETNAEITDIENLKYLSQIRRIDLSNNNISNNKEQSFY